MSLSLWKFLSVAPAAAALISLSGLAAGQQPLHGNHVPQIVSSGEAKSLGAVSGNQHLKLAITLPLRNEAQLDALLKTIYDPQSPNFHHYLSADEFTSLYAPSQADYDAAVQWAQSQGFKVTRITSNRRLIDVDGSVDVIRNAFHIGLNTYTDDTRGRTFHAPDREPSVIAPVEIYAVAGLSDAHPKHPHYHKGGRASLGLGSGSVQNAAEAEHAIAHISGSGPSNTYLPSDMRKAYYPAGTLTGAGQTVGIFSFDGYIASDLTLFYSKTGMANTVPVKNVLVAGYNGACFGFTSTGQEDPNTCDDGEQILDIVNVIGMAPGLTQVLFYEGDSATDVLNQMATDNTAKVLSSSWGGGDFGTASDPIFKQFQAQGQSYLNATGDSGQFNNSTYDPPSVDANITQVGGTDLVTTGAGGPWASETGWADSGGGNHTGTAIPSYQQLPGVINSSNKGSTTLRNAPDIAAEADFDNSTVIDGTFETGFGGTSYATPRWAGFIALANQQAVANGKGTLGFLNPALYNIGVSSTYTSNFHDITSGNNKPSAGSGTGFNAVTGYDLVTGWGSPTGQTLINTLTGGTSTQTADFSLAASPGSLTVTQGQAGASTITVTALNGFTGSVALSASGLPSGVTASFSPASTTTSSTLTLTASSTATVGAATVTVTGTSGTLTHTATIALTVSSSNTQTQLIVNPGFETGSATPWSMSSGTLCTTSACGSGEAPHSGTFFAWLDGYGTTHTDTVSQQVAIPAGKTTATLGFYLHIDTAETTTTAANDTLTVQVLNTSGTVLGTLATFSNLNKAAGYVQHTYNMAPYIGKTVVLRFTGKENASKQTSFTLDDVTLNVQ